MTYATPAFGVGDSFRKRTFNLRGAMRAITDLARAGRALRRTGVVRLDGAFREALMLAVTYVNRCRHCYFAHSTFGKVQGLSDADIAALEDIPPEAFDRTMWVALAYAKAWAEHDGVPDPDHETALRAAYSESEVAAINFTIAGIRFANLVSNTADAFLSRLRGKPRPRADGGIGSELVIGTLWGLCAIPVGAVVVMMRWKLRRASHAQAPVPSQGL